jgi:hypothetical protein
MSAADLATQAHDDARGERHQLVATAALHLVRLLQGALDGQIRLSPEERADALARGLSLGIVAALKEAGPAHAVLRLRALAAWLTRAAEAIEVPVPVATPADVPAALKELDTRRAA